MCGMVCVRMCAHTHIHTCVHVCVCVHVYESEERLGLSTIILGTRNRKESLSFFSKYNSSIKSVRKLLKNINKCEW